jgi:hypothetical protein
MIRDSSRLVELPTIAAAASLFSTSDKVDPVPKPSPICCRLKPDLQAIALQPALSVSSCSVAWTLVLAVVRVGFLDSPARLVNWV